MCAVHMPKAEKSAVKFNALINDECGKIHHPQDLLPLEGHPESAALPEKTAHTSGLSAAHHSGHLLHHLSRLLELLDQTVHLLNRCSGTFGNAVATAGVQDFGEDEAGATRCAF